MDNHIIELSGGSPVFQSEDISFSRGHATTITGSRRASSRSSRLKPTNASTINQQVICAISESRGASPTVGMAFLNLGRSELRLCQFNDNTAYEKTFVKLEAVAPTDVMFPDVHARQDKSKLWRLFSSNRRPAMNVTLEPRRYWDETQGLDYIETLAFKDDYQVIKTAIDGQYFATCCAAAVCFRSSTSFGMILPTHSLDIRLETSQGAMMIDVSTIRSLELVQNLGDTNSKDCLFGILNATLTPMGSRMLRGNILEPLIDAESLQKRLDALQELTTSEDLFFSIRNGLKAFIDMDKVISEFALDSRQGSNVRYQPSSQPVNNLIMIKQVIKSTPILFEALENSRSALLQELREQLNPATLEHMETSINTVIREDVTYQKRPLDLRNQRAFAVKADVNNYLDIARQAYQELSNDITVLPERISHKHELTIDLKFDTSRQFFFRIPRSELKDISMPEEFVNVHKTKNYCECQTLELLKSNKRLLSAYDEILIQSDSIVQGLVENIRQSLSSLVRLREAVALLDMVASFAHVASIHDYCRPRFGSSIVIRGGRHPIREVIQTEKFVANDIIADDQSRLQIITGCNMSGKSTYIRSVALMSIMAQIGAFVPATFAILPICHKLFARTSIDDSFESNISTFAREMRETAHILRGVDSRSLVIVDELGRGTSTRDGLTIAISVAEALLRSQAYVWFATHFHELADIFSLRTGATSLCLRVDSQHPNRLTMLYQIEPGTTKNPQYGIQLAKTAALPPEIITMAENVSLSLAQKEAAQKRPSKALIQAKRWKLMHSLRVKLLIASEGPVQSQALYFWLESLKAKFIADMQELEYEESILAAKQDLEMGGYTPNFDFSRSQKLMSVPRIESSSEREDCLSTRDTIAFSSSNTLESELPSPRLPLHRANQYDSEEAYLPVKRRRFESFPVSEYTLPVVLGTSPPPEYYYEAKDDYTMHGAL